MEILLLKLDSHQEVWEDKVDPEVKVDKPKVDKVDKPKEAKVDKPKEAKVDKPKEVKLKEAKPKEVKHKVDKHKVVKHKEVKPKEVKPKVVKHKEGKPKEVKLKEAKVDYQVEVALAQTNNNSVDKMEDRMVNKHKGAKMVNNNSKLLMDHLRMDLTSKDPHLKANAEVIINNLKMMDKL